MTFLFPKSSLQLVGTCIWNGIMNNILKEECQCFFLTAIGFYPFNHCHVSVHVGSFNIPFHHHKGD